MKLAALVSGIALACAGSAGGAEAPAQSARAAFEKCAAYERNYDLRSADCYAPDAWIVFHRGGGTRKLSGEVVRQLTKDTMPIAKARGDWNTYTDVTTRLLPDGTVEVRATRFNHMKRYSSPYRVVFRRSGERWLVVRGEAWVKP